MSSVIGHDESPTWRDDSDSRVPNGAIPWKRQVPQMTSRLDRSNSQVNREWIDEWGNRVRGSQRDNYIFSLSCSSGLSLRNAQARKSSDATLNTAFSRSESHSKQKSLPHSETSESEGYADGNNELQNF